MGPMPKATLHDVARLADVSIATVSRIVNEKGGVSPELDKRIRQAIYDLGYVPNTVARALKARQSKILGLIIPTVENPVFPPLVKVIEEHAHENGFSTILCNSEGRVEQEAKYIELLVEKQADGIILDAIGDFHERFSIVKRSRTPFLVIGRAIKNLKTSIVTIDNFRGGYMATDHLLQKGLTKIAFLFGFLESKSAINDRFLGYKQALEDNRIEYDKRLVVYSDRTVEGGSQATEKLLSRSIPFEGVFASNDIMAMGCIDRLFHAGLRVPEDVRVVGYDDIPFASIFRPSLTTIHSPLVALGENAFELIHGIITRGQDQYESRLLVPELVVRESTR